MQLISFREGRQGFTPAEVLIAILVIAGLGAIAVPSFRDSGLRSRELALTAELSTYRQAISRFRRDCGAFPTSLSDLTQPTAPSKGIGESGAPKEITDADWKGPYLPSLEGDPVSGKGLSYFTSGPKIGTLASSATGTATDGTQYDAW